MVVMSSQIQCGEDGVKGLNYISTDHSVKDDTAGTNVIDALVEGKKNIRSHSHNHPKLSPPRGMIIHLQNYICPRLTIRYRLIYIIKEDITMNIFQVLHH